LPAIVLRLHQQEGHLSQLVLFLKDFAVPQQKCLPRLSTCCPHFTARSTHMKRLSAPGILILASMSAALAQQPPSPPSPASHVTLEQAIQFALQHNHALEAARSTILQNEAQEITANLRPNPTLSWYTQFLPL